MKRWISIVLAALMLMLPCAYAQEPVSAAGEWVLTQVETDGERIDSETLGLNIRISLYEDGSALVSTGTDTPSTWTQDGDTIAIDAMSAPFTLEGETMWVENNGLKMILTPYVDPATLRTDTLLEEFNGTWVCSQVDFGGMMMSLSSLGAEWTLEILDGHVIFTNVILNEEHIYEIEGQFAEGVLSITYTDAMDGIVTTMPLRLNVGGQMVYAEDGTTTITYFTKVEPVEAVVEQN